MQDPKELIEECKKHLRNTASFKHEYKKDIRKLITALEKAINYSCCCKSDSELLCDDKMPKYGTKEWLEMARKIYEEAQ